MKLGYLVIIALIAANVYQFGDTKQPQQGEVLLVTDKDYFPTALTLIENAQSSIYIMAFELKYYNNYPNSQTNQLMHALIEARARGVDVRVITDEYLNKYGNGANEAVHLLRSNGIDAKLDGPEQTLHTKVLITDGRMVLLGSTNWSFTSFEKNREANVLINSQELAQDLQSYFEKLV